MSIVDFQLPIFNALANRQKAIANRQRLNSAPLRRPATVVRNRRRVANRRHPNTRVIDCANRGFTATAWTLHAHFSLLHAGFRCFLGRFVRGLLRREWSALARSTKSART